MNYKLINQCRVCKSENLTDAFSFSEQFLSPTFVDKNEGNPLADIKVPLTVTLCKDCSLVQLRETTDPTLLYTDYFYRSATNDTMLKDLKHVADEVLRVVKPSPGDVVVDIGANDGTTLGFFPANLSRIGVEPAKNISWSNLDESIQIVNDFFPTPKLFETLQGRKVKAFTSCAMFYDLDDPNAFVADVKTLLAPDGVFTIQLSYLVSMLENMNFYDICHEHLEYYSLNTLETLMQRHDLTIFDVELNAVNGGSALVFITHKNNDTTKSKRYQELLNKEEAMGLLDSEALLATLVGFHENIMSLSKTVRGYLANELNQGKKVIGLGASTKGNVLLQIFKIDKTFLPYISEINVEKIGKRTLGSDIELISDDQANALNSSTKLVLPWYFKNEIVKREESYLNSGGKLLFPMPYAHIVSKDGEEAL